MYTSIHPAVPEALPYTSCNFTFSYSSPLVHLITCTLPRWRRAATVSCSRWSRRPQLLPRLLQTSNNLLLPRLLPWLLQTSIYLLLPRNLTSYLNLLRFNHVTGGGPFMWVFGGEGQESTIFCVIHPAAPLGLAVSTNRSVNVSTQCHYIAWVTQSVYFFVSDIL